MQTIGADQTSSMPIALGLLATTPTRQASVQPGWDQPTKPAPDRAPAKKVAAKKVPAKEKK